jgi:hypothetical protein
MPTPKHNPNAAIPDQEIARIGRPNLTEDAPGPHDVSELAYQLWFERGCPIGSPDEDWFKAEDELLHTSRS